MSLSLTVEICVFACCPLQVKTEISVESKHQTLQGLAFPLQETAKRALQQLAQKHINYIQLVSLIEEYSRGTEQFGVRSVDTLDFYWSFTRCVSEVGCREGDNRAGPLQPDRNPRFTPQSSQRHSQIPLLPLQTLPRRRLSGICWCVRPCTWTAHTETHYCVGPYTQTVVTHHRKVPSWEQFHRILIFLILVQAWRGEGVQCFTRGEGGG